jgi:uncharacterized protein (DUF1800 family)
MMSLMNRRALFTAVSAADSNAAAVPDALVHLLNRTSFGIRETELQQARRTGAVAWLETQLAANTPNSTLQDSALDTLLKNTFPSLTMTGPELVAAYPASDNKDVTVLAELRNATHMRQIYSQKQLLEVMVEFWTNHFSAEHSGSQFQRYAKTLDDRELRSHALGKFRDLLLANAQGPMMQFYLDNYVNVKGNPQENYSRELMELHTLGVDGGYTEADVKEVARAFTGWGVNRTRIEFAFTARNHDTAAKTVLGQKLPAGRGIEDGLDVLNLLAGHPSTARLISSKLLRRFVTDAPSSKLIDDITAVFQRSDGDIKTVLRAIFASVDFAASADLKVKRPAEFLVSALRATDAQITGSTFGRAFSTRIDEMGQQFSNWPAPNGYPDVQSYWINTTAWLSRWNFAFALTESSFDRGTSINLMTLSNNQRMPADIVDQLSARLLRRSLNDADRQSLIALIANGEPANRAIADNTLLPRLRELVAVLLSSRYFAYR